MIPSFVVRPSPWPRRLEENGGQDRWQGHLIYGGVYGHQLLEHREDSRAGDRILLSFGAAETGIALAWIISAASVFRC